MSQTEVQLIKSNSVVDGDIVGMSSSKLSGTLPAVSAANLTNIPAANLTGALPAISGASLTNLPASGKAKNLVINGAMKIAQRGTSSTSNGYNSVDRIKVYYSGTDESPTFSQADVASGTSPYSEGFRKCFKVTNGNQTSVSSGDYIYFRQILESQDVATSGWDYKNSSSNVTLSFWIKSSVAQDFKGYLRATSTSGANSSQQQYSFATGSLSADTWTKITKTIPGNANLEFDYDNGSGLDINISAYFGTSYSSSGTTENAWGNYSSGGRVQDYSADTWYTTNDATLEVTGLQLEVGDSATDFEHLSFHEDYLRCARYYIQFDRIPVMSNRVAGYCSCTSRFMAVPMRAIPSVSIAGTLTFNSFFYGGGQPTSTTTPYFQNNGGAGQPYGGDNIILNFSGFSTSNFQTNEFGEVYGTTIQISAEL